MRRKSAEGLAPPGRVPFATKQKVHLVLFRSYEHVLPWDYASNSLLPIEASTTVVEFSASLVEKDEKVPKSYIASKGSPPLLQAIRATFA